jgi:DNA-binding XRE family transcriptional regulator
MKFCKANKVYPDGDALKLLRLDRGLSLTEALSLVKLHRTTIIKIEKGSPTSRKTLIKLLSAYGLSPDQLDQYVSAEPKKNKIPNSVLVDSKALAAVRRKRLMDYRTLSGQAELSRFMISYMEKEDRKVRLLSLIKVLAALGVDRRDYANFILPDTRVKKAKGQAGRPAVPPKEMELVYPNVKGIKRELNDSELTMNQFEKRCGLSREKFLSILAGHPCPFGDLAKVLAALVIPLDEYDLFIMNKPSQVNY